MRVKKLDKEKKKELKEKVSQAERLFLEAYQSSKRAQFKSTANTSNNMQILDSLTSEALSTVSKLNEQVGQDNFSNWLQYKRKMSEDAKLPISNKNWLTKIENHRNTLYRQNQKDLQVSKMSHKMREALYFEHNQPDFSAPAEQRETEKDEKNYSRCSSGIKSKVTADRTTISKRS